MKKRCSMKKIDDIQPLKETLKQKIELQVQRFRRFQKRTAFYHSTDKATSLK